MAPADCVYEAAKLLALLAASWIMPMGRLGPFAEFIRRWRGSPRRGATEIVIAHLLADRPAPVQAATVFHQWQNRSLEMAMQVLALHRPGREWKPVVRLEGRENLAKALRGGAGAILWISDFVYRPLVVPLALRQAGFRGPVHLSRPEHGFSVTPFGVRFLNPLWVAIENRFLTERVVIEKADGSAALKTLRDRLARNEIVSITVAETGRRTLDTKFLQGTLRLATGPFHLARTSGAPLLPVFAVRNGRGVYEVSIGEALTVDDDADPPYTSAMRSYAAALEPFVREYPDQWNGWIALGRLVENTPGFAASFDCADAIAQDLASLGRAPISVPARAED
jgi:lauroyl/myristoyl acyltransferase